MLPRYTDFVKDIALSCNILNAIGGPSAMYQFPKQFGPAIVFSCGSNSGNGSVGG